MAQYRSSPVVIEAVRWTVNIDEMMNFLQSMNHETQHYESSFEDSRLKIKTLERTMIVDIGDWVIKGANGEFYPCKDEIFQKIYAMNARHET